jgi:hypothetical protein
LVDLGDILNRDEFSQRLIEIQRLIKLDLNGRVLTTAEVVSLCKVPATETDQLELEFKSQISKSTKRSSV